MTNAQYLQAMKRGRRHRSERVKKRNRSRMRRHDRRRARQLHDDPGALARLRRQQRAFEADVLGDDVKNLGENMGDLPYAARQLEPTTMGSANEPAPTIAPDLGGAWSASMCHECGGQTVVHGYCQEHRHLAIDPGANK